jgi:hypothetical protein
MAETLDIADYFELKLLTLSKVLKLVNFSSVSHPEAKIINNVFTGFSIICR